MPRCCTRSKPIKPLSEGRGHPPRPLCSCNVLRVRQTYRQQRKKSGRIGMSRAIAVFHGCFGRATIYQLNRPFNVHAHREGHLIFHVGGSDGCITVGDQFCPLSSSSFVAVCPWEPHNFVPSDLNDGALFFVLYVNPEWFTPGAIGDAARLRF